MFGHGSGLLEGQYQNKRLGKLGFAARLRAAPSWYRRVEWPRLLILRTLLTQWVPRSFAFFAKGGSRKCRCQVGLITCPQQNQLAHAASLPTLAKNARMGHPQWEWCTQRIVKGGPPAKYVQEGSYAPLASPGCACTRSSTSAPRNRILGGTHCSDALDELFRAPR